MTRYTLDPVRGLVEVKPAALPVDAAKWLWDWSMREDFPPHQAAMQVYTALRLADCKAHAAKFHALQRRLARGAK
jgi:hypothetical protein